MDEWCRKTKGIPYDKGGAWASQGSVSTSLLDQMLKNPYFNAPPPKSTGRELFHLRWLEEHLQQHSPLAPEDVQATLCELTAKAIADAVLLHAKESEAVYICGGGAHNHHLISRIKAHLTPIRVGLSDVIGLPSDWVEACAFAWLAKQALNSATGNLPEVTGARKAVVLGAIYPA